jgi:S1-C subfamily serine protease
MALLAAMTLASVVLASIDWTPALDRQFLGVAVRADSSTVVADILPDTTAAQCGLQRGDQILTLNDAPVADIDQLRRRLARHGVGDPVTVTVNRNGRRLTLGPRPLGATPFDRAR